MKKILYGILAATMMLNAGAAVAGATPDAHKNDRGSDALPAVRCIGVNWLVSQKNSELVKSCAKYLPEQGIISSGKHKGQSWGEAFPGAWLADVNHNDKSKDNGTGSVFMNYDKHDKKFKWQTSFKPSDITAGSFAKTWTDVVRTKQIGEKDIVSHVLNVKGGIGPNAMSDSAYAKYQELLTKHFKDQTTKLDKASKRAKDHILLDKMYKECVRDMTAVGLFGIGNVMCNAFS